MLKNMFKSLKIFNSYCMKAFCDHSFCEGGPPICSRKPYTLQPSTLVGHKDYLSISEKLKNAKVDDFLKVFLRFRSN